MPLLEHPIELASTLGKGSRFSVTVPMVRTPRAVADRRGCRHRPPPDPLHGKLIVVIDDDALVLDGMGGLLTELGLPRRHRRSPIARRWRGSTAARRT